ncbi:branched-chain amino acid ABC transporter permease [Fundidesulfovibrio putealis]|uniref:branched-chain amino acid ABC transporter permease n=1 Tax=Fundidesulfovibrio putealis TaxID=270496 RepID=UPI0004127BA9|nr:branched-chain amino acid ABC transporter permease [Fundidesulfovibrio putealis]
MLDTLLQQALNALQLGSYYSLIALGYCLVYGVLLLINFAHGDIFMVGAYIAFFAATTIMGQYGIFPPGINKWVVLAATIPLTMVLTASVGVFIERVAYKPLRLKGANRLYLVITALMMGIVLEYGNLSLMGTSRLSFPTLMPRVLFEFGGATITLTKLVAIVASFMVFALLQWIVTRTKLGMAMRAVSYDKFAVPLMGIPLDVVIIFTFSLGSGMAGLAGLLYSMNFPVLDPFMGALVGWKAFVAAVVGGIGDIRGAFIGGFIMAFLEVAVVVSSDFIPFIKPEMRDLVSFSILLIILTIKPTGLFGRPQTTKI